jgi:tetratricopeptide (TPR) repeat protein
MAHSTTSSNCRTRLQATLPAPSSRSCFSPRPSARSASPPKASARWNLYLRALAQIHKITQPGRDAAIALLSRALTVDPSYAPAAAAIGWCRLFQANTGSPVSSSEVAESVRLAIQIIEIGKDQPDALWMAAYTLSMFSGAHATAAGMIDHALVLNPNSAYAWSARGFVATFQDQPDLAIEALQRAMRLSPLDPQRWMFFFGMSAAHLVARRFEATIEWADRCLREQLRLPHVYRCKAVACAHLGRMQDAQECIQRMFKSQPTFTISGWKRTYAASIFSPETMAMYLDGLCKAGLPEE